MIKCKKPSIHFKCINLLDPQKVEDFMRMQLRMIEIRNQIEMLENPVIRKTYESINFKVKQVNNNDRICDETPNVYIVTKEDTITKQMEYFDAAKKMIGADVVVKFVPTLMVCCLIKLKNVTELD